MSTAPKVGKPISEKFVELAKTLQFSWFAGHAVVILCSIFYILTANEILYRLAIIGVLQSFGIITYQHFHLKPKSNETTINLVNLLQNENVLYFSLALVWLVTPRFTYSLVPYVIFSLFHSINYMKNVLLPQVFGMTSETSKVVARMDKFVTDYNDKCMHWVGSSELSLLVLVILRTILFYPKSLIMLIVYSLFIKIRYENSKYMKTIFAQWRVRLDGVFSHPSIPPQIKLWYSKGKLALINLSKYSISKPIVQEAKKN
ncbi:hypothetical protein Kpol_1054p18 [Vanderwaltozyma polyspora DSM 70294]|uniref:Nucleoporin POM33 n=1 Tax=Vanderwaltozyma polyspora (strain ATCC 22028 / DSM 70294 / BCRC 21397 / CBS 2163 / NBRC 10782 / NRRL Y-8283 / UCD 57-17) TaxID=436907 RepID=A7TIA5_VANPO|nr:uncharacterized protein Kpol_1054p18 [Vanderwaltozyma polyspora DSM 70294]EDO17971.1 hypothetical protein Kpol_1054p18 [Vanderwaltozyma polyspora DSM 70294]